MKLLLVVDPSTTTEAVTWVQGTNATANGEDGLVSSNTYGATYYPMYTQVTL